jgi:hypothetical protein
MTYCILLISTFTSLAWSLLAQPYWPREQRSNRDSVLCVFQMVNNWLRTYLLDHVIVYYSIDSSSVQCSKLLNNQPRCYVSWDHITQPTSTIELDFKCQRYCEIADNGWEIFLFTKCLRQTYTLMYLAKVIYTVSTVKYQIATYQSEI